MSDLQFTFLGTGNAFSPGGLCCSGFLVNGRHLFDAPPQTLSSMSTIGLDPNNIETVVLSHHHGDHFLGLPFLLLHWRWKGRTKPVRIFGPRNTHRLSTEIAETVFPGVLEGIGYEIQWQDLEPGQAVCANGLEIEPLEMTHDSKLDLCLGYKARTGGRRFSYTGDTILCDSVLELARGVEVMISECASVADQVPVHMNLVDDMPKVRAAMAPEAALILTHINPDVTTGDLANTRVAQDFKTYRF